MQCSFLTASLSEFSVHADGSIERMSVASVRFQPFVPAGSTIDRLVIGEPCTGHDPEGGFFRTSPVVLIAIDPPSREENLAAIVELAHEL